MCSLVSVSVFVECVCLCVCVNACLCVFFSVLMYVHACGMYLCATT